MEHRSFAPDLVVPNDDYACGNKRAGELAPDVAPEELRQEKQAGGPVNCSGSELCTFLLALLHKCANRCIVILWTRKLAENAGRRNFWMIFINQTVLQNLGVKNAQRLTRKTFTRKTRSAPLIGQGIGERSMPINILRTEKRIGQKHICTNCKRSMALANRKRSGFFLKMGFAAPSAGLLSMGKTKETLTTAMPPERLGISCAGDATLCWG